MNNKGYIFIVRRLGKQSKLILSRSDSISNLKLNLKIHGPCGPNARAGADLQAFLIFCFKPNLLSAHKLTLLIYGDNRFSHHQAGLSSSKLDFPSWILFRISWHLAISQSQGLPSPLHMSQAHHCSTIIIPALRGALLTFVVAEVLLLP